MIQAAVLARFIMSNTNFSITAEKLPPKGYSRYLTCVKTLHTYSAPSETPCTDGSLRAGLKTELALQASEAAPV